MELLRGMWSSFSYYNKLGVMYLTGVLDCSLSFILIIEHTVGAAVHMHNMARIINVAKSMHLHTHTTNVIMIVD